MDLKRFLGYAVLITFGAIVYVDQQVNAVKLSYELRSREDKLIELIDGNRILLYNNNCLKSPDYLAGMLKSNSVDLKLPHTDSVARIRIVNRTAEEGGPVRTGSLAVLDVLVPKAQAALNSGK